MRSSTAVLVLSAAAAGLSVCHCLNVAPDLLKLAPNLCSHRLNYRVAIGSKETPFQMKDLHVELGDKQVTPKPYSTGIHSANLLKNPVFVNDQGEQLVALKHGGWELHWPKSSQHGFLVCSFLSPEDVQRNEEAKLEAGRFFMYHRVWTTDTLASERERRRKIQLEAAKYIDERDKKIKEITDEETNVATKVVSYAQAAKTMNDFRSLGVAEASFVPLHDHQVLEMTPDCIVSSRGLVFRSVRRGKAEQIGESRVDFLKVD